MITLHVRIWPSHKQLKQAILVKQYLQMCGLSAVHCVFHPALVSGGLRLLVIRASATLTELCTLYSDVCMIQRLLLPVLQQVGGRGETLLELNDTVRHRSWHIGESHTVD